MSDPHQFTNTSDPRFGRWWKSTRSNGSQGCLFISADEPEVVAIADSKEGPSGPVHVVDRATWRMFVDAVKQGSLTV